MLRATSALSLPGAVTLGLVLPLIGYYFWSLNLERVRLAALDLQGGNSVAVEIELPFVPEAFNIARLQGAGRLVRIEGSHVWLRDVPQPELRALAREYWIGSIRPWNGR